MSVNDAAISHKLGAVVMRPGTHGHHLPTGATNSPSTSAATGGPVIAEIGSTGLVGMPMTTADQINFTLDLKADLWDANLDKDFQIEIICHSTSADLDADIDWLAFAKGFALGEALVEVLPGTKDKLITYPAMTMLGALKPVSTGRVGLNAVESVGVGTFRNDRELVIGVELQDDGAADPDEIVLDKVILWYEREMCSRSGERERI